MATQLNLRGVSLNYPVYSVSAQSLRTSVFNATVGGLLYRKDSLPIVRALSDITFSVREGDRLGLIGHNGSGKTTLLKVMAGIYEPTTGVVEARGKITSTIAFGAGLDSEVSGEENIRKLAMMRLVPKRDVAAQMSEIVEFSGLGGFINLPVRTYSAGMVARLMFAVNTAFEPEILILDEWLGAGDAAFVMKAQQRMQAFVDTAKIVILASHSFDLVQQVCNKVCVLEGGKINFFGDTREWFEKNGGMINLPAPQG